jgi:NadR type nicotinamide-nucleotide adenylyltransferase
MSIRKIVILGPESTGKSTLCEQLAQHYNTLWCQEYAREYLLKHGMNYSYDDLLTIAKGQIALEDGSVKKIISASRLPTPDSRLLFIDTDMYVMKVWCEFVFEKCHPWILNQIVERKYDLYLLCNTDLPWVKDELREYPDLPTRNKLFYIYKDILVNQSTPWAEISGNNEERLQRALAIVDGMFAG